MTRIEISAAAYASLCAGEPEDGRLEAQECPTGGFYLWLDKYTINRLRAATGPRESFSNAILRMSKRMSEVERMVSLKQRMAHQILRWLTWAICRLPYGANAIMWLIRACEGAISKVDA
jgi:hypothetical protein